MMTTPAISRLTALPRFDRPVWLALWVFLLASLVKTFRLAGTMFSDAFHQGEYLASVDSVFGDLYRGSVIVIHGALDYVPAKLAQELTDSSSYFFATWLIYRLAAFAAGVMFVVLLGRLLDRAPWRLPVLLAAGVFATLAVNYRDLFLLASLVLFFRIQDHARPPAPLWWEIAAGIVLAGGIFWSYDRGIGGAAGIGLAALLWAIPTTRFRVMLLTGALVLLGGHLAVPQMSLVEYVRSINFLREGSANWNYGWTWGATTTTVFLVLVDAAVLGFLWRSILRRGDRREYPAAVALTVVSLVVLKTCLNRADIQHSMWALWCPILAVAYAYGRLHLKTATREPGATLTTRIAGAALLLALPVVAVCGWRGDYHWVTMLGHHTRNEALVPSNLVWAADKLRNAGVECVFDMSNNGMIPALVGRPGCTRFAYLIYATRKDEAEIMAALEQHAPKALVFWSKDYAYAFDGRPMNERFPLLDARIRQTYTREECNSRYCVRFRD